MKKCPSNDFFLSNLIKNMDQCYIVIFSNRNFSAQVVLGKDYLLISLTSSDCGFINADKFSAKMWRTNSFLCFILKVLIWCTQFETNINSFDSYFFALKLVLSCCRVQGNKWILTMLFWVDRLFTMTFKKTAKLVDTDQKLYFSPLNTWMGNSKKYYVS